RAHGDPLRRDPARGETRATGLVVLTTASRNRRDLRRQPRSRARARAHALACGSSDPQRTRPHAVADLHARGHAVLLAQSDRYGDRRLRGDGRARVGLARSLRVAGGAVPTEVQDPRGLTTWP